MRALLSLELKLAALRDKLYIERMEEAAAEEDLILTGRSEHMHPAFAPLTLGMTGRQTSSSRLSSPYFDRPEREAARNVLQAASGSARRAGASERSGQGSCLDVVDGKPLLDTRLCGTEYPQDERDRMHWEEFEQTWSKRRRLAREKNEIETPKIGA